MNYLKLYDLERYLFEDVRSMFHAHKRLSAFDFFCIIIWKANRAKSKVAHKLLSHDGGRGGDLDAIVTNLTSAIAGTSDDKERMRILVKDWDFRLPMASAILTVLYPDKFTVYDGRVCDELGDHYAAQNKSRFDELWDSYQAYLNDVNRREPNIPALRDKDRTLWAKSFEKQLKKDIATVFRRGNY